MSCNCLIKVVGFFILTLLADALVVWGTVWGQSGPAGTAYLLDDGNDSAYTLDLTDGSTSLVGELNPSAGVVLARGIEHVRDTDTTYVISPSTDKLYALNRTDGGLTEVCTGCPYNIVGNTGRGDPWGIAYAAPNVGAFSDATAASTSWTAPAAMPTDQTVTLTLSASDDSLTGTADVTGAVPQVDLAPTVSVDPASATVRGNATLALDGTATDPNGDTLTYSWTASPNVGSFADAAALDTTWTAPTATASDQAVTLTITVSDSVLQATAAVSVTVLAVPPPTVSPTRASVLGGETVGLDGTAVAPAGETLTFAWAASPNVGSFADNTALDTTWTAPAATEDDQAVTLTLTISGGSLPTAMLAVSVTVLGTRTVEMLARKGEAARSLWASFVYYFPGGENGLVAVFLLGTVCGVFFFLRRHDFAGPATLLAALAVLGALNYVGLVSALVNVIVLALAALGGLAMYQGRRNQSP